MFNRVCLVTIRSLAEIYDKALSSRHDSIYLDLLLDWLRLCKHSYSPVFPIYAYLVQTIAAVCLLGNTDPPYSR